MTITFFSFCDTHFEDEDGAEPEHEDGFCDHPDCVGKGYQYVRRTDARLRQWTAAARNERARISWLNQDKEPS